MDQAEQDKVKAMAAYEESMQALQREKEEKKQLEEKIKAINS